MKKQFSLLFVMLFCSAWTFSFIEKPGHLEYQKALNYIENEQYAKSETTLNIAQDKVIDNETKSKILIAKGKLYAMQFLTSKTSQEGIELIEQGAKLGNDKAYLAIGDIYRDDPTLKNDEKAREYYRKVANHRTAAQLALAELEEDEAMAAKHFAKALDLVTTNTAPSALYNIGEHFELGSFTAANQAEAESWYQKSLKRGHAPAAMRLASLYTAQAKPNDEIHTLWEQAADLGNSSANRELGFAIVKGEMAEGMFTDENSYFEKAIKLAPREAYRIARQYETLPSSKKYQAEIANWFSKAAELKDADGLLRTARLHWHGSKQIPQDRIVARIMYNEAAIAGNDKAVSELAKYEARARKMARKRMQHARKGRSKGKTYQNPLDAYSFAQWQKRADHGNAMAMYAVGRSYIEGREVNRDTVQGISWLELASDAGNMDAMLLLAKIHGAGLDVPTDLNKSYSWYEKAALLGNGEAQYQLGLGYARGIGVNKNEDNARKWLGAAQNNGYAPAQAILETLR